MMKEPRIHEVSEETFRLWKQTCEELLEALVNTAGAKTSSRQVLGKLMLNKTVSLLRPLYITLH